MNEHKLPDLLAPDLHVIFVGTAPRTAAFVSDPKRPTPPEDQGSGAGIGIRQYFIYRLTEDDKRRPCTYVHRAPEMGTRVS
jgi:hypothetical protein